jgi:hypothetical protein
MPPRHQRHREAEAARETEKQGHNAPPLGASPRRLLRPYGPTPGPYGPPTRHPLKVAPQAGQRRGGARRPNTSARLAHTTTGTYGAKTNTADQREGPFARRAGRNPFCWPARARSRCQGHPTSGRRMETAVIAPLKPMMDRHHSTRVPGASLCVTLFAGSWCLIDGRADDFAFWPW